MLSGNINKVQSTKKELKMDKERLSEILFILMLIIAVVIYFAGIFYFGSKGATFEQCVGWPIPWLFIGSIVLGTIKFIVEEIIKK